VGKLSSVSIEQKTELESEEFELWWPILTEGLFMTMEFGDIMS
jgi:hypothetical protein